MSQNRFPLLIIILLALALRLTLLGEQSLWYDEGVTWLLSQKPPVELLQWTAADIQPPLYYLLIWETDTLFGASEWALRFPSVFFGVLTLPVIYTLARRLFAASPNKLTAAPHLAAALFAISPVMVYYAQEARMYTLLIFETSLASYLLLKLLSPSLDAKNEPSFSVFRRPAVIAYILTFTAALYTHYFAAFLLVAHGLYAIFILWQRGWPNRLLRQLLQMFGLVALLFAPWLWILLARLNDDPSYWPGALKLHEALRQILISFTAGETVLEQTGMWLALGYLLLLVCCAGYGRVSTANARASFFFLLLWLCLPVALVLLLSYQSPKFNPRYTLLAWPAFALMVAAGLGQFQIERSATSVFRFVLFTFFYAFILATSIFSLSNWFTDPRFAKDDFQALAQFVREREAADETVLLSSGHMYPVWAYYYGWQGWTALPQLERLDVNRVTDLSISSQLAQALHQKGGVWLVSWQDEVIDPNGIIPFWLDRIGQRPVDAGDFQGVRLEHWRLDPDKMSLLAESPIERPVLLNSPTEDNPDVSAVFREGYNFAGQVDLVGVTPLDDHNLALFWRPRRPLPDDLLLTLHLTDPDGFTWHQHPFVGRPGAYLYPPSRWPIGQLVMTRHPLDWRIGTPPGLYWLEVALGQPAAGNAAAGYQSWDILDEQDRPLRPTGLINAVNVRELIRPQTAAALPPLAEAPLIDFSPIIFLRQSDLSQTSAEPGDRLLLKLWWQAGPYNFDDISVGFDLLDARGQSHRVGASLTPSRKFNLPRWQAGDLVLGQYWLDIPATTAPGPAHLQARLVNVHGFFYEEVFPFDQLEILPSQRNFDPPAAVDIPVEAHFSGQVSLIGADCRASTGTEEITANGCSAAPGETVTLTLYWRADAPLSTNYTIFTHLLGPGETVLVNADHTPPKPTQGWVKGEIIADVTTLTLPQNLPPGDYPIEVGLYNAADPALSRLPLTTGQTRVILPQPLRVE